jgi:hypothetical protein
MLSEHTRGEGILAIHTRVRLHIYTYSDDTRFFVNGNWQPSNNINNSNNSHFIYNYTH